MPDLTIRSILIRVSAALVVLCLMFLALELLAHLIVGRPAAFLYSGSFHDRQTDWNVTYGVTHNNLRITCAKDLATQSGRTFAVLGNSFVFGQGVADCHDVVSNLQDFIKQAVFLNYGIIGAGIEIYQLVTRDLLGPETTDVIIIFYGNDISELSEHRSVLGLLADESSTFAFIRKASRIATMAKFLSGNSSASAEVSFNNIKSILRSNPNYFFEVANPPTRKLQLFRAQFSELIGKIEKIVPRTHIWIAVAPEATTVSDQVRSFVIAEGGTVPPFAEPGSGYKEIENLASRRGIKFVDLFPKFLALGSKGYFPHDLHWSVDGHRLAANMIADAVAHTDVVEFIAL